MQSNSFTKLTPCKDTSVRESSPCPDSAINSDSDGVKSAQPEESREQKQIKKRFMIAKEILETEINYVNSLNVINSDYIEPLKEQGLLTPAQMSTLFSNVSSLPTLHAMIKMQLETRVADGSWNPLKTTIGDIFMHLAPFLKVYSVYITNFDNAMNLLEELLGNHGPSSPGSNSVTSFSKFEESVRTKQKGMGLSSFLLTPIQRIPRYKLLLEDLLKNTPENHPDREPLSKALVIIAEAARYNNEKVKMQEGLSQILSLEKKITGLPFRLVTTNRCLLMKSKVTIANHKSRYGGQRQIFLFNDMILFLNRNFHYRIHFQLHDITSFVQHVESAEEEEGSGDSDNNAGDSGSDVGCVGRKKSSNNSAPRYQVDMSLILENPKHIDAFGLNAQASSVKSSKVSPLSNDSNATVIGMIFSTKQEMVSWIQSFQTAQKTWIETHSSILNREQLLGQHKGSKKEEILIQKMVCKLKESASSTVVTPFVYSMSTHWERLFDRNCQFDLSRLKGNDLKMRLLELTDKLCGLDSSDNPSRSFILYGEVQVNMNDSEGNSLLRPMLAPPANGVRLSLSGGSPIRKIYVFLFSDVVLLCRSVTFSYLAHFQLHQVSFKSGTSPGNGKKPAVIMQVLNENVATESLLVTLNFQNAAERDQWLETLQKYQSDWNELFQRVTSEASKRINSKEDLVMEEYECEDMPKETTGPISADSTTAHNRPLRMKAMNKAATLKTCSSGIPIEIAASNSCSSPKRVSLPSKNIATGFNQAGVVNAIKDELKATLASRSSSNSVAAIESAVKDRKSISSNSSSESSSSSILPVRVSQMISRFNSKSQANSNSSFKLIGKNSVKKMTTNSDNGGGLADLINIQKSASVLSNATAKQLAEIKHQQEQVLYPVPSSSSVSEKRRSYNAAISVGSAIRATSASRQRNVPSVVSWEDVNMPDEKLVEFIKADFGVSDSFDMHVTATMEGSNGSSAGSGSSSTQATTIVTSLDSTNKSSGSKRSLFSFATGNSKGDVQLCTSTGSGGTATTVKKGNLEKSVSSSGASRRTFSALESGRTEQMAANSELKKYSGHMSVNLLFCRGTNLPISHLLLELIDKASGLSFTFNLRDCVSLRRCGRNRIEIRSWNRLLIFSSVNVKDSSNECALDEFFCKLELLLEELRSGPSKFAQLLHEDTGNFKVHVQLGGKRKYEPVMVQCSFSGAGFDARDQIQQFFVKGPRVLLLTLEQQQQQDETASKYEGPKLSLLDCCNNPSEMASYLGNPKCDSSDTILSVPLSRCRLLDVCANSKRVNGMTNKSNHFHLLIKGAEEKNMLMRITTASAGSSFDWKILLDAHFKQLEGETIEEDVEE